jgi:iron-sulfur cluster repair protein YtfE (RIC family)
MTNDLLAIRPNMTVNEVIAAFPATVTLFRARGVDSCCGGALTLATVAEKHGLDLSELIASLAEVASAR